MRANRHLVARLSKAYVVNLLGLDPKTLALTQDSAWITLAQRLKAQAAQGLAIKRRSIGHSKGQLAASK